MIIILQVYYARLFLVGNLNSPVTSKPTYFHQIEQKTNIRTRHSYMIKLCTYINVSYFYCLGFAVIFVLFFAPYVHNLKMSTRIYIYLP